MRLFKRYRIIKEDEYFLLQKRMLWGWFTWDWDDSIWRINKYTTSKFDTIKEAEKALYDFKSEVVKYL